MPQIPIGISVSRTITPLRIGRPDEPAAPAKLHHLWIGAVGEDAATVTARVDGSEPQAIRFVLSTSPTFDAGTITSGLRMTDAFLFVRETLTGLLPATRYYVGVAVGGEIDGDAIGSFRTAPRGAHGFSFGFASCASTGSDALVFDRIRGRDLDLFVHLGDLHYAGIGAVEAGDGESFLPEYHAAFDAVFAAPRQNLLWRSVPMLYTWDDHDYGANNSDGTSRSRRDALAAFRARVPVPAADASAEAGIYYSFVRGRVRFLMTDVRSERSPQAAPDGPAKIIFSDAQKDWFRAELAAAREQGQFVIWANAKPWAGATAQGADWWGGYDSERQAVLGIVAGEGMAHRLCMISGDMHAVAYLAPEGNAWGRFPVMQAAPLDRTASHKGGPYTRGPLPSTTGSVVSQFGIVDIADDGGASIGLRFRGIGVDRPSGAETTLIDETFSLSLEAPRETREVSIPGDASDYFTYHQSGTWEGASTGSGTSTGGTGALAYIGRRWTGSAFRAIQTFMAFDTASVSGAVVRASLALTLANPSTQADVLHVRAFGWSGQSLANHRSRSELGALPLLGSLVVPHPAASGTRIEIPLDASAIPSGVVRILVHSGHQMQGGTAPSADANSFATADSGTPAWRPALILEVET